MPKPLIPDTMLDERSIDSEAVAVERPQLLWPSPVYMDNDASCFPTMDVVQERYWACKDRRDCLESRESLQGDAMGLLTFKNAVMEAQKRLLVLDPYFDEVGVDAVRYALELSHVREVRILTREDGTYGRQDLLQSINRNRTDGLYVDVQWVNYVRPRKRKKSSYVRTDDVPAFPLHDRYAIVDDALWHFGATVGGAHECINAASGPWSAVKTRAVKFFDEWWRRLR